MEVKATTLASRNKIKCMVPDEIRESASMETQCRDPVKRPEPLKEMNWLLGETARRSSIGLMARQSRMFRIGQLRLHRYNLRNGGKRVSSYAKRSVIGRCTFSETITRK